MKAKHILGEKVNKNHSQAIPGMAELKTDQYYGTYKWSKEVAGHDGKKQTAPKGNGPSFKDAAVVGGISKTEHEMSKKAAKGKVTPITPEGSKEDNKTNTTSPISGNVKEARMSAAVKLQRAWEREQAKSAASRKRGEEVMAQAKANAEKKKQGVAEDAEPMDREFALVKKLGRLGERIVQNPKLWDKYSEAIDNDNIDWIIGLMQDGTGATSNEVLKLADLFGEIGGGLGRLTDFAWAVKEGTWEEDFMNPYRQHRSKGVAESLLTEMDKSGPQPGRDGKVSHKTYGSRDNYKLGDPERMAKQLSAEKSKKDALDILNNILKKQGAADDANIGQEWMSDTELDQYVPDSLQDEWRELVGYDIDGMTHPLWRNMTSIDEPNSLDPEHRKQMVRVANKWFAMKKIPNVKFYDVKDANDELEWLVQVGKGVEEARDGDVNFGHTVTRGAWVVYDGDKVKRFKTHTGAKAYAEKNGGKVASSEFYHDKIQKQGIKEGLVGDFVKKFKQGNNNTSNSTNIVFYAKNPDGTKTYAHVKDEPHLGELYKKYKNSEIKTLMYDRPEVVSWLKQRGVHLSYFWPGAEVVVGDPKVKEAGMPASVIKIKQKYAAMSDKDFAQAHKDKSEDELKAMAWRHGYGKDSLYYVDKHKKGQQGIKEFAPVGGDDGDKDPEEILHRLASIWWTGTEKEMIKAERTLASMGWEIGEDEGYDQGGVFVVRAGDENGKSYISWPHEDLQLDESMVESKMSEADAILRQIAADEDWDMLYDVHKLMGKPTPEGMAGNIIDDMYQDAAIESGHHADDDFEEIYNIVLDRLIDEYGIEEGAQLNEVDPRNYDSDIDYYNALRRQSRKPDIDDYDPPEPYDPYAEFEREEQRRRAKAAKTEPKVEYSKEEGRAPNGKRFNMTVTFTSPDKHRASYAADRWMDLEWGAKTLIDKEQHEHNGDTTVKIYVQDNHKHGYWKPWKDEEPISKGLKFEDVTKGGGYSFDTGPKFVPRDTLGTDMSYHWGAGGGNKYGINSKLGPREDPRFGKRDDGKQGYRPEFQKPSEYDHGADRERRSNNRTAEMDALLSKYGRLNSKLNRLERTNRSGSNDYAIRNIKRELETLERTIIDLGGQHHLRHYTESVRQSKELTLLEQKFVSKFENKYKRK